MGGGEGNGFGVWWGCFGLVVWGREGLRLKLGGVREGMSWMCLGADAFPLVWERSGEAGSRGAMSLGEFCLVCGRIQEMEICC